MQILQLIVLEGHDYPDLQLLDSWVMLGAFATHPVNPPAFRARIPSEMSIRDSFSTWEFSQERSLIPRAIAIDDVIDILREFRALTFMFKGYLDSVRCSPHNTMSG